MWYMLIYIPVMMDDQSGQCLTGFSRSIQWYKKSLIFPINVCIICSQTKWLFYSFNEKEGLSLQKAIKIKILSN